MQVSVHLSNQSRTLVPELMGETSKELLITLKISFPDASLTNVDQNVQETQVRSLLIAIYFKNQRDMLLYA